MLPSFYILCCNAAAFRCNKSNMPKGELLKCDDQRMVVKHSYKRSRDISLIEFSKSIILESQMD
jgi:hypothetical protein